MKRVVYAVVIILALCVATISFAQYVDAERAGNIRDEGVRITHAQSLESAPPLDGPPRREQSANRLYTNAPKTSELPGELLLVNSDNPLPENFRPEALVRLYDQKNRYFQLASSDIEISKTVYEAMKAMFADARQDGVTGFIITSGYRSHEKQKEVFTASKAGIAAAPGESEHETGLAFDVTAMGNENFELTLQFEWLSRHCAQYGFIIRYPKDMESVTGFPYEPWHYRYVGKAHASSIMDMGITLEQYLEKH